jgi:integral membrane protein
VIGRDTAAALNRYRVMAYVVGTMLIILVFVAIPLQYGASRPGLAEVVAPLHGYLYIVYLVAGADLARRAHWRLGRILMVVCAGFVPFLAFVIERRVNRQMQTELAAAALTTGSGPAEAGSVSGPPTGSAGRGD